MKTSDQVLHYKPNVDSLVASHNHKLTSQSLLISASILTVQRSTIIIILIVLLYNKKLAVVNRRIADFVVV